MDNRRSKRRRGKRESGIEIFAQRVWRYIGTTEFVGVLFIIAGVVVALAPSAVSLEQPSIAWFVTALHDSATSRTAASFFAAGAILLLSFAFVRLRAVSGRRLRGRNVAALAGVVIMGIGITIGVSNWFTGHFFLPVSRVSIAAGQTVETIPTMQLGRTMNLMLPLRTELVSLDIKTATVKFKFFRAGESEGVEETAHAGEPLVVGDYRLALLGYDYDQRHLQVGLKQPGENTIATTGTVGAEVQFELEGPKYTVKNITRNYLGVLGPAAKLADEDDKTFWVFQREPSGELQMTRGITITEIKTAPLAVLAISSASTGPDLGIVAVIIFLIGMVLFVGFPDPGDDSLNEFGAMREVK